MTAARGSVTNRQLELWLKKALPIPIGRGLRKADNYMQRLSTWASIALQIRGVTRHDRRQLRRAILRAPITSLLNLSEWSDPVLLGDALVDVPNIGRFNILAGTDNLYIVLPSREWELIAEMRTRLKPGDTFVDAGANIGFFSVLGSQLVGPGGKVIAIEMMPDVAARLREHIALNECANVQVLETALGDRSGQTVTAWVVDGRPGVTSIVSPLVPTAREMSVQTTALKEVLSELDRVALMKLDVERAELAALQGAEPFLSKVEAIVFEQLRGETSASAFLKQRGFEVRPIGGSNFIAERKES
jgi:FkbM family methyltransferase